MSCGKEECNSSWNKAIAIGGGIAIGVAAVTAIVAAPIEIAVTAGALGLTKWALKKNNEHTHDEPEPFVEEKTGLTE